MFQNCFFLVLLVLALVADADIVVVNGDLMDGVVSDLGDAVKQLGDLKSKQGVYFTTGNHEYISGIHAQDFWPLSYDCTVGQNNQRYRLKYLATRSSVRSHRSLVGQ